MKTKATAALAAIAALAACTGPAATTADRRTEERVDSLLSLMTLEEKVGQMAQMAIDAVTTGDSPYSSDLPLAIDTAKARQAIVARHVGSFLNTANGVAMTLDEWNNTIIGPLQQMATTQTRLGIPIIYGVDAVHGANYTQGATLFPQQIAMAATWNPDLMEEGSAIAAYETRASGIPWVFAPVLDLGINPCWPRHWETFGEDVCLATQMGLASVRGFEGADVSAPDRVAVSLKHFLGYSASLSGQDRTPAYIPENILRQVHLPAFEAAIRAGAKTVMINSGVINGESVHASHFVLTRLLKDELGFDGVAVTDWADINNLCTRDHIAPDIKSAIAMAINAGIDMSMIPYDSEFCPMLADLVREGRVPMSRIDDAARRVIRLKMRLRLFERPTTAAADYPLFGSDAHRRSAYRAACQAMTLLRNEDSTLPLDTACRVLVCGPNANSMRALNGGWSYTWQGVRADEFSAGPTIVEAIRQRIGAHRVSYVPGVEYDDRGKYYDERNVDIEAATRAARGADVVVLCLGENSYTEKPGDLTDLHLSANQTRLAQALAATGKPVVLVLNEGRPHLITDFARSMKAILMAYLPGDTGGEAVAAALFGDICPGGRLPFSYPMYPNAHVLYNHKPCENQEKMAGAYDYEGAVNLLYPFGHGLSYTSFEYQDLTLSATQLTPADTLTVTVTVTNTGSRRGDEVVQLYFSDLVASLTPDNRRLCAFERVSIDPGRRCKVSFRLPMSAFGFVGLDNRWRTEPGEFELACSNLRTSFWLR